jgi:bifunctional non-homologous end joining protein LigD
MVLHAHLHPSLLAPYAHAPSQVLAMAAKRPLPAPATLAPMLATRGNLPAAHTDDYAYEVKWDGYRAIAHFDGKRLRLLSRNGIELGGRFTEIAPLSKALRKAAVLDGEIIASDRDGHASFSALQTRMPARPAVHGGDRWDPARHHLRYMVFDLLHYDGRDLTGLPYEDRRALLESLHLDGGAWTVPPMHADGPALLGAMRASGQEGVIAKRLSSLYLPGRRSPDWIKVTVDLRDEFVVAGFWSSSHHGLASLLLSHHQEAGGDLVYCGKVGTGFDESARNVLEQGLRKIATPAAPLAGPLPRELAHAHGITWCRPVVVAQIRHRGWTHGGALRHPSFIGLRPDLRADDIIH